MDKQPRYYKEAVKEEFNWIPLLGLVGLGAVLASPLPVIVGAGLEALYLLFIPDTAWYRARVDDRHRRLAEEERRRRRAQIAASLDKSSRQRYEELEALRERIESNLREGDPSVRALMEGESPKLEGLSDSFLHFLVSLGRYRAHLSSLDRDQLEREIALTRRRAEQEEDARVKKLWEQNLDVLQKRLETCDKIARNAREIQAQLQAIENTFQLINDRVVSMRSPAEIASELEGVVRNVGLTEAVIEETAPLLEQLEQMRAAQR